MTDKPVAPSDLRALWQRMPTTPMLISPPEMRKRAGRFQNRVRRRNFIEYGAAVFVIAVFTWYGTFPSHSILWPIANAVIILGVLLIVWNLHRQARAVNLPSDTGLIDFHRAELARQRDALSTVGRWYILPIVPGLLLFQIAIWIEMSRRPTFHLVPALTTLGMVAVVTGLVFWVIIARNHLGAARLQRMIEDLDRYKETD